jgi:hypothetical protein
MDQPDNAVERDPSVAVVAIVSLLAGLACAMVPGTTARVVGIDTTRGVLRSIGRGTWHWRSDCTSGGRHGRGCLPAPPRTRLSQPCHWPRPDHDGSI